MPVATRRLKIIIDHGGDAAKGLSNLASGILPGLGKAALGAAGGVALLGGAVGGAGAKLIMMGSDADEMVAKFDVVFGPSAEQARLALEKFGDEVGRNTFDLMAMAASVQDTFVPLGFARDEAAKMSEQLTELAVDVGSFNNSLETDVMADFQSAIVGNHETVRKYGIVITQATLDQELMRMGIEDGIKAATEQEKVQARLNLIMAGSSDAIGDAARTSGSWANQTRALKSELAEAATTMGQELIPVVLPLLQSFTTWVREIMPKAVAIFKEWAGRLNDTVGPAMLLIQDAVTRIAQAFGVQTDEVTTSDAALWAFEKALDAIITAIQLAALVMQGLAWGIEHMKSAIESVIGYWNRLKDAIRDAVDGVPDWLIPGSPTPFEMGLRGIGEAIKGIPDLNLATPTNGTPLAGGGNITINLTYSPAVSLADRYEAETKLVPYIQAAMRQAGA